VVFCLDIGTRLCLPACSSQRHVAGVQTILQPLISIEIRRGESRDTRLIVPLGAHWFNLLLWLVCTAMGFVAGLIFGWFLSPFSRMLGGGGMLFFTYLHYQAA
jgi:hypothetical protein